MSNEVGLHGIAEPEAAELQPTLAPRLFGRANVIHDVVEWAGPEQSRHTYRWGKTRCGYQGKTYDVETWRRGTPSHCKHCEARRGT